MIQQGAVVPSALGLLAISCHRAQWPCEEFTKGAITRHHSTQPTQLVWHAGANQGIKPVANRMYAIRQAKPLHTRP
jgi:hypothetical protein